MIWLILGFLAYSQAACNDRDRWVYQEKGSTFPTLFRSFGGMWVSQSEYEEKIVEQVGLSPSCAECYGQAYMCGYGNCKWNCIRAGQTCDACLDRYGCKSGCNICTGF